MKTKTLLVAAACAALAAMADGAARVDVPPQFFRAGGWKLDVQFMDAMGSPMLIAHGMGRKVPDATCTVELPEPGKWRVMVRAKNWLPPDSDWPADAREYPGSFKVLVDGVPLAKTFGRGPKEWTWEDGGEVEAASRTVRVALRDETGFDGRCAGIAFLKGGPLPANAPAIDGCASRPDESHAFDFVVVGGGVPGCCAALAAARAGVKTALVQDRPVRGGNSSSEIRVWSAGEMRHPMVKEMRSLFMNRDPNQAVSDADRLATLEREPNLSVFLCSRVFAAEKDGDRIASVRALDWGRNRTVAFSAPLFCDATGDGWLGFYAGAEYRYGREARAEFDESFAPEKADRGTLGASLMWESAEANADVPFSAPWAEKYACGNSSVNGEWNWEYGLDRDMFSEGEAIRDRLLLAIYGAFSNAKKEPANARRLLVTCPFLLGKRESRRLMGDYVYSEKDVTELRTYPDAVATGSWSVDLHYVITNTVPFLTRCHQPHYGRYYVPYRSLYSRNVSNLFMAGRCFSCTHVGLGGPRVINTLSQMGVAVGVAAAMCREKGLSPRGLYERGHSRELQRRIGGDWPGNPDPEKADWLYADDEDAGAKFTGKWSFHFNYSGGQRGNRSHTCAAGGGQAKATYPLPANAKGRYRLLALVPYTWHVDFARRQARVSVSSAAGTKVFAWNQAVNAGEWNELGEVELANGGTISIEPASPDKGCTADGFAFVPVK